MKKSLIKSWVVAVILLNSLMVFGQKFQQPEFAIGFWVDPPMDDKADVRYKEIADANFTLVLGGFGARSQEQVRRQLDLCERYGLNALVWSGTTPVDQLPADSACWGYMLRDEPDTNEFKALGERVEKIRKAHPGKLSFVNLLPNYATPAHLKAKDYEDYLEQFVRTVQPEVLSTDHYPLFKPGKGDPMPLYRKNLVSLKEASEKDGIPFWMFFNVMPYGPHTDPTEAQIRWQVYTAVTYGAKGVFYFCYYTPAGHEFPKGGAIIDRNGRKTRHYEQARRINGELKKIGPVLMKLSPIRAVHLEGKTMYDTKALAGSPLSKIEVAEKNDTPLNMEMGLFKHADGREGVILMNNDLTYTIWPTMTFNIPEANVVEIDKSSGKEVPLYDESPEIPGLQISFDVGDGRIFLMKR